MVDHEGRERTRYVDDAGQRYLRVVIARDEDVLQVLWILLIARIHLQDDAILITLGIDHRHLALSEGVVERVVDVLNAHTKTRRRLPVDGEVRLQTALLAIAVDVGQSRDCRYPVRDPRRPGIEVAGIGAPQRELIV